MSIHIEHHPLYQALESRAAETEMKCRRYRKALEKISVSQTEFGNFTFEAQRAIETLKEFPEKYEETLKKFLVKGQEAEA